MKNLMIIGASGHGKVIADIATCMDCYQKIAFLDDDEHITECMGFPVLGNTKQIAHFMEKYEFIIAIGNAKIRHRIMDEVFLQGGMLATLIHPQSIVSDFAQIGAGSVVMPGAIVNAGAMIAQGCIVNTGATVDHDCQIGDFVHVSVGAHVAGAVEIGDDTWIGAGAVVSNNVKICKECMIGAGAVVVHDLHIAGTYVGVPARFMDK